MNTTIDRIRQHADLCMSESLRASVTTVVVGASFAGTTPAAGQKSAVLTAAFAGTTAWSPPS